MNPTFIKSYPASADCAAFRIAKFSDVAASNKVAQATAATSPLAGVIDSQGAKSGGMVDLVRGGTTKVRLGDTVSAGDFLTSDANGKAVKCVPAAGETREYIGKADEPGVADDLIECFVVHGLLSHPAA